MNIKLVGDPCDGKEVFFDDPPTVIRIIAPGQEQPILEQWPPDQPMEPYKLKMLCYRLVKCVLDGKVWVQYQPEER